MPQFGIPFLVMLCNSLELECHVGSVLLAVQLSVATGPCPFRNCEYICHSRSSGLDGNIGLRLYNLFSMQHSCMAYHVICTVGGEKKGQTRDHIQDALTTELRLGGATPTPTSLNSCPLCRNKISKTHWRYHQLESMCYRGLDKKFGFSLSI